MPVRVLRGHLDALGEHAGLARFQVTREPGAMRAAQPLGDDFFRHRLAHHVLLAKAKGALGGGVEIHDFPLVIHGNDGVERAVEDGGFQALAGAQGFVGAAVIRHVAHDFRVARELPGFVAQRGGRAVRPEAAAVLAHQLIVVVSFFLRARLRQFAFGQSRRVLLGGEKAGKMFTEDFHLLVAEDPRRPDIPHVHPAAEIEADDGKAGRALHEQPVVFLARADRGLRLHALGDVLEGEDDALGQARGVVEAAAKKQHGAPAEGGELVGDLVPGEDVFLRQHLLQQRAQGGDVPLAIAQLVDEPALGLGGRDVEALVKNLAGRVHAQVGAQDEKGQRHGAHGGLGVVARGFDLLRAALQHVDVAEDEDRTVDLVVVREVGTRAQGEPAARFVLHLALADAHGVDDFGEQALEMGRVELVPQAAKAAPEVGGAQVEKLRRRRGEAAHGEVARQQQDGGLDADLEIAEVGVEPVQLGVPADHFVVDGGQLFVAGLELFLRGLQLFIDALEFLVGGLHLLAGGLQLLSGGLVLLLHGKQVVARLRQFALECGDAFGGGLISPMRRIRLRGLRGRRARLLEEHEIALLFQIPQRDDLERDRAAAEPHAIAAHGLLVALRFRQRRAQREQKPLARHLQQVKAGLARGRRKERAGRAAELQHLPVRAHQHTRRRKLADRDAVRLALRRQLAVRRVPRRRRARDPPALCTRRLLRAHARQRQAEGGRGRGFAGEDFLLLVRGRKEVGELPDGFARAEEKKAARLQRVMERGEDFLLQLGLEIDEQIPAGDEVHARERRIAHHILPGKDDLLAQRLAHTVAAVFLHEKPPQPLRRDVLRERLRVEPVARLFQQRLIEIGGEDLELRPARIVGGGLGESHGQRIRLLAGGAAEHPHAHRLIAPALREELREDRALQRIEGLGIAEEAGDADEHVGVKRVEFLRVALQKSRVIRQRRAPAQHRAPRDAPLDGARFVERKIHPAVLPQNEQDFPKAIVLRLRWPAVRRLRLRPP